MKGRGREATSRHERERGWVVVSSRRPKERSGGHKEASTGWRLGTTFFVRNFPEDCRREELWRTFGKVGKVEDVFVPAKRDKWGHRFGFVRISGGGSEHEMLAKMNRLWIGTFLIRAYLPRHARSDRLEGVRLAKRDGMQTVNPRSFAASRRLAGVNYIDALRGKGVETGDGKVREGGRDEGDRVCDKEWYGSKDEGLIFESRVGERGWVEGAYTGQLHGTFSWSEHRDEIKCECDGSLNIFHLGDKWVLIMSTTDKTTKETLAGYVEWSEFWFNWTRPWVNTDVSRQREVWTCWLGVPLQAWSERFFGIACTRLGRLTALHRLTSERERLDVAFVKVTTSLEPIDRMLDCRIDGVEFRIRVDEVRCSDQDPTLQMWEEESDTESELALSMEDDIPDDGSSDAGAFRASGQDSDGEETVEGGGKVAGKVDAEGEGTVNEVGGSLGKPTQERAAAHGDKELMIEETPEIRESKTAGGLSKQIERMGGFSILIEGVEWGLSRVGPIGGDSERQEAVVVGSEVSINGPAEEQAQKVVEARVSVKSLELKSGPGLEDFSEGFKGRHSGPLFSGPSSEEYKEGGSKAHSVGKRGKKKAKGKGKNACEVRNWKKLAREKKGVEEVRGWKPFVQGMESSGKTNLTKGMESSYIGGTVPGGLGDAGREIGIRLGMIDSGEGESSGRVVQRDKEVREGLGVLEMVNQ